MQPRPSQRVANVAYYARNRDIEIERVRLRQDATLARLREVRRVPCADCGLEYEPHQMDFDHRDPAQKRFRLTAGSAMLMSERALIEEIAKCDVVCANCHRIRTRDRKNGARRPPGSSKHLERKRAAWQAQARLLDQLRDVPCLDCQQRFPPCAMDFDHRDPATKRAGVTRLVGRAGTGTILAEVAKCDIVCANCHRSRTFERRSRARVRE